MVRKNAILTATCKLTRAVGAAENGTVKTELALHGRVEKYLRQILPITIPQRIMTHGQYRGNHHHPPKVWRSSCKCCRRRSMSAVRSWARWWRNHSAAVHRSRRWARLRPRRNPAIRPHHRHPLRIRAARSSARSKRKRQPPSSHRWWKTRPRRAQPRTLSAPRAAARAVVVAGGGDGAPGGGGPSGASGTSRSSSTTTDDGSETESTATSSGSSPPSLSTAIAAASAAATSAYRSTQQRTTTLLSPQFVLVG